MVTRVVPDAEVDAAAHGTGDVAGAGPSVTAGLLSSATFNNAEQMSLESLLRRLRRSHHSRASDGTADQQGSREGVCRKAQAGVFGGQLMNGPSEEFIRSSLS